LSISANLWTNSSFKQIRIRGIWFRYS
jgi:hypothetical protein